MNEKDFIRAYAKEFGTTLKDAAISVEAVHTLYKKILFLDGEDITISKLWSFKTKEMKAKKLKHPKTGEPIEVPAKKVVRFKQSNFLF